MNEQESLWGVEGKLFAWFYPVVEGGGGGGEAYRTKAPERFCDCAAL